MTSTSGKVYKIEKDPVCGRQLVATRKIFAGELIIDEPALLTGPGFTRGNHFNFGKHVVSSPSSESSQAPSPPDLTQEEHAVCLVCCVHITFTNQIRCTLCNLLLCSESCQTHPHHSRNECLIFRHLEQVWNREPTRSIKSLYNLVLVIRGLLYRFRDRQKWDQIQMLESKLEALESIGAFSELQDIFNIFTWDMFASACSPEESTPPEINGNNYSKDWTRESIVEAAQHCLGVMRVNAFSCFTESYSREGLFFLSSLMSHSCVINTDRQIEVGGCNSSVTGDIGGSRMVVRASVDIEKNEPITTTYLSLLYSSEERNRIMITSWLFTCDCKRCRDPTECQTFLSSVICQGKIGDGIANKNNSILANMVCDYSGDCLCKVNAESKIIEILKSRPKNLYEIRQLEDWLDQFDTGKILHPNHSVFIHVKLFLCQFYGRQTGGLDVLSVNQLKRKILYCQQILSIYNEVCPGIQMCRGVILFELWCTLSKLAHLSHVPHHITYPSPNNKNPTLNSMSLKKLDITQIKMEALDVLKHALPNSSEEAMAFILQEDL